MRLVGANEGTGDSRRWVILAAWAWALVAAATCGRAFLIPLNHRHVGVYEVYAVGGKAWLDGGDLYADRDAYDVFRYGPVVALLMAPLGAMSLTAGSFVWRVVNVAVMLGGLVGWVRVCLPPGWTTRQRALVLLLSAPVAASGLIDGQANPLLIGLFLLAAVAAEKRWWMAAAVCLALPVVLKVWPIACVLLFLVVWPRQLGWRVAAVLTLLLAAPLLLRGTDWGVRQYHGWFHLVAQDQGRQDWPLDMSYRDLRLVFRVWLTPLPAKVWAMLQAASAAALAAACCLARRRHGATTEVGVLMLGLGVTWMMVLGPATEGCAYVMLAPVLAWALVHAAHEGAQRWLRALLATAFVGLILTCAVVWFPGGKLLHNYGPHPLMGMLVGVYLCGCAWQAVRADTAPGADESCPQHRAA